MPKLELRSRTPYWLIAILLAGVLLYFSLRGIQWERVWSVLTHAKIAYVALWLALISIALLLRALRWRILLRTRAPISFPTAFWATSAGSFGNNFLPARAGELVRTMMVSAQSGLPATFVLTTALSERLCDAIALVIISSVVLLALPTRPGWFDRAARPFAAIGLCGVLAIVLLPMFERLWNHILGLLPAPDSIRHKLAHALEQILIGVRAFHDPGRLLRFIAFTCIIWLTDAIGARVGMISLGLHASLAVALLLITGLGLGSALPSTPGYVGIYQFVAVSVLMPFGFSRTGAIAYILLFQALQYATITFWGLLALARSRGISRERSGAAIAGGFT
jgi:glycosyltransferase 2 family protein